MRTASRRCTTLLAGALVVVLGCSRGPDVPGAALDTDRSTSLLGRVPPDATAHSQTDDGRWVLPAKNFASTQRLSQITTANVGQLQLAWTFSTGVTHSPGVVHDGQPLAPHDLWTAWSFEPAVVAALALSAGLYLRGARALWRGAGRGRGVQRWEAGAFAVGWMLLLLGLVSPLHRLGEVLFSAHMAQHELLMAAAAPLLVLGRPIVAFLWAVPISWRRTAGAWSATRPVRTIWGSLTRPLTAWTLHAIAIWTWHAPALYQATLASETIHTLQHLSFLGTGLLFWWSLFRGREGRLGTPFAVVYLFTTAIHTSLLGALLTFSSRLWYPLYASSTSAWGLTPLEDQQLAGVIMWVPASLAYLIATLAIAGSWLREPAGRPARVW